ncbi:hypothetical protein L2E82_38871 [Cichorium intybus]|uniref:Uncharacterized protein n=1 Tax=Cichorium intybus TaxID=13427 RepID=A0ACB9AG38_CICIN|nr:hypothetical protein L2E82_38871 [Cichorium intybus]
MEEERNSRWSLLSRLRTAVKKVTFLMNSNVNRWRVASSFIGRSRSRRRLSFGERLGLTLIVSSSDDEEQEDDNHCDLSSSSHGRELEKSRSFHVQRTMSFPEEDDVDKRAEMFIENFYRQLKYERQVSLQLRYRRDTSFGSSDSNSP